MRFEYYDNEKFKPKVGLKLYVDVHDPKNRYMLKPLRIADPPNKSHFSSIYCVDGDAYPDFLKKLAEER